MNKTAKQLVPLVARKAAINGRMQWLQESVLLRQTMSEEALARTQGGMQSCNNNYQEMKVIPCGWGS